jgi:hypothetical protein
MGATVVPFSAVEGDETALPQITEKAEGETCEAERRDEYVTLNIGRKFVLAMAAGRLVEWIIAFPGNALVL